MTSDRDMPAPSPDAASVKPACLYCGSEMRTMGLCTSRGQLSAFKCASCGATSPPRDTNALALAAARRPAHPARELTEVEQAAIEWARAHYRDDINPADASAWDDECEAATEKLRAAVARALAIVRGET